MAVANLNDMATLATDAAFGSRVLMALVKFCTVTVPAETIATDTVQIHTARKNFAAGILNSPNTYKPLFVNAAAANQTVANDATATATLVGMTPAALATAALQCTDTNINNAVAASFNAFIAQI